MFFLFFKIIIIIIVAKEKTPWTHNMITVNTDTSYIDSDIKNLTVTSL